MLLHLKELTTDILLLILIGPGLALTLLTNHPLPLDSKRLRDNSQGFSQALPGRALVNGFGSNILLYMHPPFIDIDSRSEEHTSELQSRPHLVCRLLLEKKKKT